MDDPHDVSLRIRPLPTLDTSWWFEGCLDHRLLIQRCAECSTLRHPPRPMCDKCRSTSWDSVESAGAGTLYSYVVVHHPQLPGYRYPLVVGLVELVEGTRLVGGLPGVQAADVRIGMPVELTWLDVDDTFALPEFRVAGAPDPGGVDR